jgi:hypothetical protein
LSFVPSLRECVLLITGSAILSFGLYHVHSFSSITEGGVLGAVLLIQHWVGLSPAVIWTCYEYYLLRLWAGVRLDIRSYTDPFYSGGAFSLFYALFEQGKPLWA